MTTPTARPALSSGAFKGMIGVARRDITPPVGIYARSWGAAEHDTAGGIHRPLTATALAIRNEAGAAPLALLTLDLGWWRRSEEERLIRSAVLNALAADTARILIHFSHTHAGPSLCRAESERPGGHLIAPYLERLQQVCVEIAVEAAAQARPAMIDWAYGRCSLARNRDLPDPGGSRWVCGYNPAGEADDTLLVGRVTAAGGETLATLVNYACHPTTLAWQNRLISPDFVGAMREVIETVADAPCLFLQGASGELAPARGYTSDTSVADRNGRQLGYAALEALEGMLPAGTALRYAGVVESGAPLAIWEIAPAPVSSELAAECIQARFDLKAMPSTLEIDGMIDRCTDGAMTERLRRKRWVRESVGDSSAAAVPAWTWRTGETLWVAHPNEAYSQLQQALRARYPGRPVIVMNVTNGHTGYLPPRSLYDRDLYPVWQTPFAAGSLERLIDGSAESCDRLLAQSPE